MARQNSSRNNRKASSGRFQISNGPVVPQESDPRIGVPFEYGELPKNYGAPILFAIPRDPHTIFTYWNIDWSEAFARNLPADRQVYLRVKRSDGSEEAELKIEPMLGTHYAPVTQPRGVYQVELGFYQPPGIWNSVAVSESVAMPPDRPSESLNVDVATVPFHLSFQRMIDLFRAENSGSLASILARLEGRASSPESEDLLTEEEREILRAMNLSLSEIAPARRAFADRKTAEQLRKRVEAILGFGPSSPAGGFGESSWGGVSS